MSHIYEDAIRVLKNTKVAYCGEDYARSIDAAVRLLESFVVSPSDFLWNVENNGETPLTDSDYQIIGRDLWTGRTLPNVALRQMATVARHFEVKASKGKS